MRTDIRKQEDTAAELFGGSTERTEFERSARDRADEPQTAGCYSIIVATIVGTIITTIGYGC